MFLFYRCIDIIYPPEEGAPPGAGLGQRDNANGLNREFGLYTQCFRNPVQETSTIIVTNSAEQLEMTLDTRTRTRVGTWNLRTFQQIGKLNQLTSEARRLKLEIFGVSETRWTGFGKKKHTTGEVFLYSSARKNFTS